jgi:two-component system, OmpR family, sensor histidine kinase PrrB
MRLSTRFAWTSAVIPPVLLVVTGLVLLQQEGVDLRAERDARLQARAEVLVRQAPDLVSQSSDAAGVDRVRQALATPTESVVIDVAGRRITAGTMPSTSPLPVADGPFTAGSGSKAWRGYSRSAGTARVWALESASVLNDRFGQFAGLLLFTALFSIPVALGAGVLLGRRASRPLRLLHTQAVWVAAGPARRMAMRTGVTEVDQVAMILDVALANREIHQARTAEAWQAARSFAATAAHELRTPLTSMQTSLDILSHPGAQTTDKEEALADLAAGQQRLLGLLDVLRALSQAELAGLDKFASMDLAELAESAVHAARARHPGADFTLAGPACLTVFGWQVGLRMAIDNLLDNAALHGRSELGAARVRLTLGQWPGEVWITVDDDGSGVAPQLRTALFSRFTRRPGSPGFGLGLAIVAQVAQLHGGTAAASAGSSGRGTSILIRFPDRGSQSFPKNQP